MPSPRLPSSSESSFTKDGAVWKDELQRHCEEVYDDKEETAEVQKERIMEFKTVGDTFHGGRTYCRNYG